MKTEGTVVIVEYGDTIQITTPENIYKTCIYLSNVDGGFVVEGGINLIQEINDPVWIEKIKALSKKEKNVGGFLATDGVNGTIPKQVPETGSLQFSNINSNPKEKTASYVINLKTECSKSRMMINKNPTKVC